MKLLYPFLISLIAGLSTMIGVFFIFIRPKNCNRFIGICLSFSATIMLLISITDLIPEGFFYIKYKYSLLLAILSLILMILLGLLINTYLNRKIHKCSLNKTNLYRVGMISLIALMIHNLPEGILTFLSSTIDLKLGLKYGVAIMLHNIPEGIAIAVPIYYSTYSIKKSVVSTLISGLSEPLGALLAYLFLYRYISNLLISFILLFVAGIMISISINDIFIEAYKYKIKNLIVGVLLGVGFFVLNQILFS